MNRKHMKRSFCLLLALLLLLGAVPMAFAAGDEIAPLSFPFGDVPTSHPHRNAIAYVYEAGIMTGTAAGTFSPNTALSRAQIATILMRLGDATAPAFRPIFSDVVGNRWYSAPITWAYDANLVSGVGGGRFAPGDTLSIEQLAAMMHRFASQAGYNMTVPDWVTPPVGTSRWAEPYVRWALNHGLIPNHNPSGAANRGVTANFIYQFRTRDLNQQAPMEPGNVAAEVARLLAQHRALYSVRPLIIHEGLTTLSQTHSTNMREHNIFSHNDPVTNQRPDQRIDSALLSEFRRYFDPRNVWGGAPHSARQLITDVGSDPAAIARALLSTNTGWETLMHPNAYFIGIGHDYPFTTVKVVRPSVSEMHGFVHGRLPARRHPLPQ